MILSFIQKNIIINNYIDIKILYFLKDDKKSLLDTFKIHYLCFEDSDI